MIALSLPPVSRPFPGRALRRNLWLGAMAFSLVAAPLEPGLFAAAPPAGEAAGKAESPARPAAPDRDVDESEGLTLSTLSRPTEVSCRDFPLEDGMRYLADYHNLPIRIDEAALKAAKVPLDAPLTLQTKDTPFGTVLEILLEPLALDWHVDGPGFVVTTRSAAALATRRRFEIHLEREIEVLDRICALAEPQRQKVRLAGRGDIKTHLDRIAEARAKLAGDRNDPERSAALLDDLGTLKQRDWTELFGGDSLFRKSIETTLTADQAARYAPVRSLRKVGGKIGLVKRGQQKVLGALLTGPELADDDLAHLTKLTGLKFLQLDVTRLSDAGLGHLKGLKNLEKLILFGARDKVSEDGIAELKRALPNVEIDK